MSRVGVGTVIEELLTDRELRVRFALEPIETIAELFLRGFDLSPDEAELLCRTDAAVWFLGGGVGSEVH
jgi:hypothetical protein